MAMLLTCKEAAAALSDFKDGVLPLSQFLKIRVHLFNCPGCRTLLATLRALPDVMAEALAPEDGFQIEAQRALEGALSRLAQPAAPRAWAATPIPHEARQVLEGKQPDLAMRLLASTHDLIARERMPAPGPQHLPREILDQLPAVGQWRWHEGPDGARRAELLTDPSGGRRLLLVYAPPGSTLPPHQHLGSESILVLDGGMDDGGHERTRGAWVHHPDGSCHSPQVSAAGCWCLIREEGTQRLLSPSDWSRSLKTAS